MLGEVVSTGCWLRLLVAVLTAAVFTVLFVLLFPMQTLVAGLFALLGGTKTTLLLGIRGDEAAVGPPTPPPPRAKGTKDRPVAAPPASFPTAVTANSG